MHAAPLSIPGILLLTPKPFADARGVFYESYNQKQFSALVGTDDTFVQDNHSKSAKGVLRGLHYQLPPHGQGKLVRVLNGAIFDVVVDLRRHSPTFGAWAGTHLTAENKQQLWMPAGFAHGFLVLEENTEVLYKTTDYYAPAAERSIRWDDPAIGIQWPFAPDLLADKDKNAPLLAQADLP
jgi:dTDP-4-dehydrorhamnose 3,5-epimerase